MPTTHTLVIGAGQAGLAMSRCLTDADIDHAVLERGRTADRWHSERWDSLRLLTPSWATRLPGWTYRGAHPDGYMTASDLATYLTAYARSFDAPIEEGHDVRELQLAERGFTVRTSEAAWSAVNVVLATGWCDRVPRRYRGMDIWWWLDQLGTFAKTIDEVNDATAARNEGALQLVGRDDHRDVDLPALQRLGVRITGRLAGIDGDHLRFADGLQVTTAAADERLNRLLARIDRHITATGLDREVLPAVTPARLLLHRTGIPSPCPPRPHRRSRLGHRLPP